MDDGSKIQRQAANKINFNSLVVKGFTPSLRAADISVFALHSRTNIVMTKCEDEENSNDN